MNDETKAPDAEGQPSEAEEGSSTQSPRSERGRILGMVSEGTISVDEAEQLLRALDPLQQEPPPPGRPRGPFFTAPVLPIPPVPPVPPVPPAPPMPAVAPLPPGGPWQYRVERTDQGDVMMYGPDVKAHAGKKNPGRQYALHFEVRDGGKRMEADLPLGLAQSADRFLPRQMRPYLEEFGVDVPELLSLVQAASEGGLPQWPDLTLFEMKDDDKGVRVALNGIG